MKQNWEDGEKPNFGPDFGWFGHNFGAQNFFMGLVLPVLDVRHCCKLSLHAFSRKTNDPNSIKWQKNSFWI